MNTFGQGLEVTAIGMALVFLSLILVAVLIWALGKIFRPAGTVPTVSAAKVKQPLEDRGIEMDAALPGASPLEDQAAAIAVVMALQQRGRAQVSGRNGMAGARVVTPMPWERTGDLWGEDQLQGETITVINIDPGSGNWKSQGRIKGME